MRDFCIYIVTFSFSAFIASCYVAYCKHKKKNNILIKSIWYFLIILPVAFLAGVRYGIGTDYHNYINTGRNREVFILFSQYIERDHYMYDVGKKILWHFTRSSFYIFDINNVFLCCICTIL